MWSLYTYGNRIRSSSEVTPWSQYIFVNIANRAISIRAIPRGNPGKGDNPFWWWAYQMEIMKIKLQNRNNFPNKLWQRRTRRRNVSKKAIKRANHSLGQSQSQRQSPGKKSPSQATSWVCAESQARNRPESHETNKAKTKTNKNV